MKQRHPFWIGVRGLAVVAVATVGLAGCAESTTHGDALAEQAADTDQTDGDPTRTRPAAGGTASPVDGREVSSPPAAMQACTALVDDGRVVAAAGSRPTVERAYTVRPADLDVWWQKGGGGPLTGPDGTAVSDEDAAPVTICLIHADAVAAPGSPDMTDEYQWEVTAILSDGTPRPLTASIARPTDLPPAAERDR